MNTIQIEQQMGIGFCVRQNVSIERGQGNRVWDEAGREYLDFTSGWGVTSLGHSHPAVLAALSEQGAKLMQNPNSGFTYSPARARLLQELAKVLPPGLSHSYFVNSGAEANDAAIKLARKITGRSRIVSTVDSFHGRTFNTLSVSGGVLNTSRYLPQQTMTDFVDYADIQALERVVSEETAAVIVEPVQGEGGVRVPGADYLLRLREVCDKHGTLLIVDEIQTGFCRTGSFFASYRPPVPVAGNCRDSAGGQSGSPWRIADILTMGKGIASGFPFAAFSVSSEVNAAIELGDHGGTYCGNPLGCAIAAAVIRCLREENVAKAVHHNGLLLIEGLLRLAKEHSSVIRAVRGRGLLCAVELYDEDLVENLCGAALEQGLLLTPTRQGIIRFIPSLLTTPEEIDTALRRFAAALDSTPSNVAAEGHKSVCCAVND